MLKFSAWLACLTGMIFAARIAATVWLVFDADLYAVGLTPAHIVADCLGAALLIGGGILTLRKWRAGPTLLGGSWGFVVGTFHTFITRGLSALIGGARLEISGWVPEDSVLMSILTGVALIGFLTAVIGARPSSDG